MMRVTNKMLVNELNRSLANNLLRMDKYQRQLSTTRRINTPSDDPAGLVKSLRLRTNLTEGEQYLANINESLGFLDTTDAAFGNINEILHDAREMAVKASTDSNVKPDFAAIAKKIREMNEQLKMIANSTYGSKYIFAGSNVTETPYENAKWRGNSEALETEIGVGVKIPYNIDAREFFTGRLDELQVDPASGINAEKVVGKNLQEGDYEVDYSLVSTTKGTARESGNMLTADNNTGMFFFYDNAGTPANASIAIGTSAGSADSVYSGFLNIEVTAVDEAADTLTVNISGRIAIEGKTGYQDINIAGVDLKMAAAANDGEILKISKDDLETIGGLSGATQDLVLWNNSGSALAGITAPPNSEFAVGDKAQISLSLESSSIQESQSYLSAVPNAGSFFYEDMGTAATLGVGVDNGLTMANNSPYSGSILVEAAKIAPDSEQVAVTLKGGSVKGGATLVLDKPLYLQSGGTYTAIADGTELRDYFTYQPEVGAAIPGAISSAIYNASTGEIDFKFNIEDVKGGDIIKWNNDWDPVAGTTVSGSGRSKMYYQQVNGGNIEYKEFKRMDESGHATAPLEMKFDNSFGSWKYNDNYLPQELSVNIKAHLYTNGSDGKLHYKYVELNNVVIDPEIARGQEIFKIPASEINDLSFTEDLVIWNNGNNSLGGIDPDTPQLKAGDKTVISFSAQGRADAQNADIDFSYTSAKGEKVNGSSSFRFDIETFDYETTELQFFTLNEETGLAYSGEIALETGVFGASDPAVSFSWRDGLFGYMEDLARKIEAGKVSETSLQIGGDDSRMEELLLYRSTVGARVNRLELQQSRLESIQETFTSLLSKTEDANMAEVIMQLQLQENVYRASLAAGARIIQPSLLDFLR
ncbi:MAG: flagellar hook-associated protein FlgL [Syntrophomonas sp.]|uniref:flagellar hook-associated protein FlgL n=1 Tax=Syntrophomonas sp. TaxID=2053627 RepID=UPI0026179384|nr:flagellar hook-associated protein FlgL [Syntrophomonas sp.]MDD2510715.1 flagellar hook-associated protein FlgL [Syntrophomonas sp.]MDD3880317.1 flagellar hook-associated protein FlgL [Syntrophomonas sp.]MDD4626546.1 flagellar hook-associated protein FlgL [Syntrophomonas sp.]